MWTELQVVSAPVENNHFQHVIAALGSCYVNGGAKFVRFSIEMHPVLNWFAARQNLRAIDFIPKFLSNPPVVDILAAEGLGSPKLTDSVIDESSAFTLDGELAKVLKDGGAYPNLYKCTDQEAKNLGNAFCAELFADRYSEISMFRSYAAWSSWFIDNNEIWNRSWFGFDTRLFSFWLLALTDTD